MDDGHALLAQSSWIIESRAHLGEGAGDEGDHDRCATLGLEEAGEVLREHEACWWNQAQRRPWDLPARFIGARWDAGWLGRGVWSSGGGGLGGIVGRGLADAREHGQREEACA
ncbi:MAG: hypothetical protein HC927_04300 [Deltaproteobacteria bacterium]|nr:hypothetical protein [Deltaproteobacteria bacterium]